MSQSYSVITGDSTHPIMTNSPYDLHAYESGNIELTFPAAFPDSVADLRPIENCRMNSVTNPDTRHRNTILDIPQDCRISIGGTPNSICIIITPPTPQLPKKIYIPATPDFYITQGPWVGQVSLSATSDCFPNKDWTSSNDPSNKRITHGFENNYAIDAEWDAIMRTGRELHKSLNSLLSPNDPTRPHTRDGRLLFGLDRTWADLVRSLPGPAPKLVLELPGDCTVYSGVYKNGDGDGATSTVFGKPLTADAPEYACR